MKDRMKVKEPEPRMDWTQVALNGGPPCFALNTPNDIPNHYCGRAERWEGHGHIHDYVSLETYIATVRAESTSEPIKALTEALEGLGWHSQNKVDICWCHVKSDGYARHTEPCKAARAALAKENQHG